MPVVRRFAVIAALVIAALAVARPAAADIRLTGFGGFSFLDDGTKGTAGASLTFGGLVGFEFEAARTWLGDLDGLLVSDAEAHMTTYMGNVVVRLPAGPIQPYASAGVGTVRVSGSARAPGGVLDDSDSSFGWNIGGGLYIVPLPIFAIRADVRRIEAGDLEWDGLNVSVPLPEMSFWRVTAGLTLKF